MNIVGKKIWQHAAGDNDRNYADLQIKWGVILNGPGYAGSWPECAQRLRAEDLSAKKVSDLRRFAEGMQDGDLVVLRIGTATVLAVGEIVGGYEWRESFGDVDGWDLQHVRRVRWLWSDSVQPKIFDTYALKLGDTTQLLNEGVVMRWLADLAVDEVVMAAPLPALPAERLAKDEEVSLETISTFLFDKGVASASITSLLNEIGELTRIARWYRGTSPPSEHETVAYLVVPLLRALGWTPQRMAVEWNYIDVALFETLPRSDQSPEIVVEAKKMNNACLTAKTQAASYAAGKPRCHRLIVTDGMRFGVYTRSEAGDFKLYAYLNLTRRRPDYPIYGCHGAEEALLAMAPEWKGEKLSSNGQSPADTSR